jgi:hypothetical protein
MPLIHKPKYPVVNNAPNFWQTVGNYNLNDYGNIAAFTGAGILTGIFGGSRRQFRPFNARLIGSIGFCAGFTYAFLSSTQRFMGLEKNDYEVSTYGAMSMDELSDYEQRSHRPNIELIDSGKK